MPKIIQNAYKIALYDFFNSFEKSIYWINVTLFLVDI